MDQTPPPELEIAFPDPAPQPPSDEGVALAVYGSAVRWAWLALVAMVAAIVLVPWVPQLLERPDIAKGKHWRASSVLVECDPEKLVCGNAKTAIFFHTRDENQPWLEFDLQTPTRFSEVVVYNRRDGDQYVSDRAVPLILEVGDDQQAWRPLGQQNESFKVWTPRFEPTTARYVRLRSPRTTMLHLEAVKIHP